MSFMRRFGCALLGIFSIIGAVAAAIEPHDASELPKGPVVVARLAPVALLIWDASPAVGDLVIAQRTGEDGMRALEADAVAVLAAHAPALHAGDVELHVQYAATGVVGAAYQASTFANATPLLILRTRRALIASHANTWERALAAGKPAGGLSLRVTGQFPHGQ